MISNIEKDIYRTLCYFGFFKYPVTALEIYKWMMNPSGEYSLHEITDALKNGIWLSKNTHKYIGFYGIEDVSFWVQDRRGRFADALAKREHIEKFVKYLKRIPSIQCIGLCNSLPFHFTTEESDIDVFIITDADKLWSTRLSSVGPLMVLKQRPGEKMENPIDCSFFLNAEQASLEEVRIDDEDPYLAVWIQSMVPLYERREGDFGRFFQKNEWAQGFLPQSWHAEPRKVYKKPRLQLPIGFSEAFAEKIQRMKMPSRIKMLANDGSEVVISDKMLKFHLNDRRQEIIDFINSRICNIES